MFLDLGAGYTGGNSSCCAFFLYAWCMSVNCCIRRTEMVLQQPREGTEDAATVTIFLFFFSFST